MIEAVSYTSENLPALTEEGIAHLEAIKARAAIRKAERLSKDSESKGHPKYRKLVPISSTRGKLVNVQ